MLAKVFPPDLVDRVVDEAGVREQRKRTLPARVVVYLLLAMVLFFQSGYGEVWNKLVQGLEWARQFRVCRVLGEDHPDTLRSANNLASDLRNLGEYQAARELGEGTRMLDISITLSPEDLRC